MSSFPLRFGAFAALEQHNPRDLVDYATEAERQGFDTVWASDHFHPWSDTDAHCGQVWVWLGAAGQATHTVGLGTGVTCPFLRYNPCVVAQAFATLGVLFPGRVFLGLGTGEGLNEVPCGYDWPSTNERFGKLEESLQIIRRLWTEKEVDYQGQYFRFRGTRLYTKPARPLPLYVAANGKRGAELVGKYADGLLTLKSDLELYTNTLFPAIKRGAEAAGRDASKIEKVVEVILSYSEDFDEAVRSCEFWRGALFPEFFKAGVSDPRVIEEKGKLVGKEMMAEKFIIVTSPDEAIQRLEPFIEAGFDQVLILSSSPDQVKFLQTFGSKVFPHLRETKR